MPDLFSCSTATAHMVVNDEALVPSGETLEIVYENKLRAGLAKGIDRRRDAIVRIDEDDIRFFGSFESPIYPGVTGFQSCCPRSTRFIRQTSLVIRSILRKKLALADSDDVAVIRSYKAVKCIVERGVADSKRRVVRLSVREVVRIFSVRVMGFVGIEVPNNSQA